jgi:hypothetical protein
MKYTIYAITEGKVKMYCYALTSNQEWWNEEKIAEANTVKEAQKIIKDLGEIELVA